MTAVREQIFPNGIAAKIHYHGFSGSYSAFLVSVAKVALSCIELMMLLCLRANVVTL